MGDPWGNLRWSFQSKVLVPVLAALILLPAITVWIVNRHVSQQVLVEASQTLATADAVFASSLSILGENRLLGYRTIVQSRLVAVAQTEDPPTIKQQIDDTLDDLSGDADWILYTLADGRDVPGTPRGNSTLSIEEVGPAARNTILKAFEGKPVIATISVRGNIFNIVCVPVIVRGGAPKKLFGVLTVGTRIGESSVLDLKRLTGAEVLLFADGREAASTLRGSERNPALLDQFNRIAGNSGNGKHDTAVLLDGEHFMVRGGRFKSEEPGHKIGYVLLSSYERRLLDLRQTRQTLVWVSALAVVLSAGAVWLLIRRITEPLRALRDSAEAVGRGDFTRQVVVNSNDECGQLAHAFNQMTQNLQTSRTELEKTVHTLRTTQAQLVQSEKLSAVGQFVAGVAHELNNPLTTVIGFSELLRQGQGLDAKRRGFVDYIVLSAGRCHKIVHNLLSFARQHPPERKLVHVGELIDAVIEFLGYELRTTNVEIRKHFRPDLPQILGDPHQLQQVFLNIVANARQAIETFRPKGLIQITTETAANRVRITFQDDGPGIKEENLSKIFDPFFTTKPVGKGTGLGLSLVYGIIKEHSGSISVRSKPGDGTAFIIELPFADLEVGAAAANDREPSPTATASAKAEGRRVLVIDDEESILNLIAAVLTTDGYAVDTAQDGQTALDYIGRTRYDVVVSDWKMQGLSGMQVYDYLKASGEESAGRMIFMTGDAISENFQQFLQREGRQCLPKPFSLQDFRSAVANVLPTR